MAQPSDDESDHEMGYSSDGSSTSFASIVDDHFGCSFCCNPIAGFLNLHFRYAVNTVNGLREVGIFSGVDNVLIDYETVQGHGAAATVHCLTCLSFLGWKFINLIWSPDPSMQNGRFLFMMDKLTLFPLE